MRDQKIVLDVTPGGIIPVVHVSQHDVNRCIVLRLFDGNNYASLPNGAAASIEGTKPSKKAFQYDATIQDGHDVVVYTQHQMTIEEGTVECKIKITGNGGIIIGTSLFFMEVEQAGIIDSADVSETVLPVYMEAGRQYMLGSEAWAVGTKDGTAVPSSAPQYHNNSKYWAEQAAASGEGWEERIATAGNTQVGRVNTAGNTQTARVNTAGDYWDDIIKDYADAASAYSTRAGGYASEANVYRKQAAQSAENGREWAKSWAVYSDNPDVYGSDWNNSQYYADRSHFFYDRTVDLYNKMREKIDSILVILRMLITQIHITTQTGDRIVTQSGDSLVINFAENVILATQDDNRLLTQRGNNIAVSR